MSNLSIQRPASAPVQSVQPTQAQPPKSETAATAAHGLKAPEKASSLAQDMTTWSSTSKSQRVKTAISEPLKGL